MCDHTLSSSVVFSVCCMAIIDKTCFRAIYVDRERTIVVHIEVGLVV